MSSDLGDTLKAVSRIERRYRRHKPSQVISPEDDMIDTRNPASPAHYMEVGRGALDLVLRSMVLCQKPSIESILDMPCGFGRELRHFVAAFPTAKAYACELYQNKIDYCAQQFGATPVLSSEDLSKVQFDRTFDLVWAGSLLTHLPEDNYLKALSLYSRVLAPGGIALITLQGRHSERMQRVEWKYMDDERFSTAASAYQASGFGHVDYDGQPGYGITFALPSFVLSHIETDPTISVRAYIERGWDDHQDVLVIQKVAIDHSWTSLGKLDPPRL
jgi:SAM-dependent methyltransferase